MFPADGDYVFETSLHYEPLGGLYGRTSMSTMGLTEHIDVSINGERVALLDAQRADERDRSEERPRAAHAADPRERRAAARVGRVHPAARRPDRRPARAAREHARRRQHQLRRHDAAAPARHDDRRAVARDRRVGHAEPPQDLHVPPDGGGRGGGVRDRDRQAARHRGVPRRGRRRRPAAGDGPLRAGPQGRRLRSRHPPGAPGDPRQPALPLPPRAAAGDAARRAALPHRRSGPGVAALVLPVGHGARRPSC